MNNQQLNRLPTMSKELKQRLSHQLSEAEKRLEALQNSKSNIDKLQAIALVNKVNELKFKLTVI